MNTSEIVPVFVSPFVSHHKGVVFSVSWSPDGETLASGSKDTMIQLWNIEKIQWYWQQIEKKDANYLTE
ncbi:MAG: WD40 repeat domain-containing protein [Nitrosomonas sp.]